MAYEQQCVLCKNVGEDRRTLGFWNFDQIEDALPHVFVRDKCERIENALTLLTCKDCRGEFLDKLKRWMENVKYHPERSHHSNCWRCLRETSLTHFVELRYFYDLKEISRKFGHDENLHIFFIHLCDCCRESLVDLVKVWIEEAKLPKFNPPPDANIPVRVHGRPVMMTPDEYNDYINKTSHY